MVKDINYAISVLDPNGVAIYSNIGDDTTPYIGIKASEGIDTQKIFIELEGMHSMTLALTGTGFTNWESYVISEIMFEVGKAGELIVPTQPTAET